MSQFLHIKSYISPSFQTFLFVLNPISLEYFAQVCPPQIFVTLYAKHILEAAHALFGSSAPPSLVVAPLWKAIFAATDGRNPS